MFHEFAPYFTEEVRRNVVERYGNPTLLQGGLKIFTTMDSERQRAAPLLYDRMTETLLPEPPTEAQVLAENWTPP